MLTVEKARTHKDLEVWNEGIELVTRVYSLVSEFPREEKYGLVDQIKRSVVSIPSNIAEGASRNSKKEFLQFLGITMGSISELETQLIIAQKLGFITDNEVLELLDKEKCKVLALMKQVRSAIY